LAKFILIIGLMIGDMVLCKYLFQKPRCRCELASERVMSPKKRRKSVAHAAFRRYIYENENQYMECVVCE